MSPQQTTAYIEKKANEMGVDPALALSLAELTGYSPKWSAPGRSGILQIPNNYITDKAAFESNPEAQIDAGLMLLAKQQQDTPNDFGLLAQYTGSPKTALKAYLRTMKNRGESVSPDEVQGAIDTLGLDLDPMREAKLAGVTMKQAANAQQAQQPQAANAQQPQEPMTQPQEDPMDMVATSTTKDRRNRVQAAFGDKALDGDIPEDLLAYVRGLV